MEETEKSGKRVPSKQKTQPDGDEEPRQYGLCCDACRAEGKDTRLLGDGGGTDWVGAGGLEGLDHS